MRKVDGERTRGESERESERERERDRESEKETAIERENGREREREWKIYFETNETLCFIFKSNKELFVRFSKAKYSYLGVSEATLFETMFETQKNYKKYKRSVIFRMF